MDVALDHEHPGLIAFLRPALGMLALWAFPAARRPVDRADRSRILALGALWMAFPLTMFPLAQQWIDSSVAGMLNSGMPVATVLVGATLFGVRTGRVQLLGVAVVLARVATVATVLTLPYGLVGLADSSWSTQAFAANLAVGVGGTGIAYVAAATLIGRVGPVRMSIVTYLVPVVAAVLGIVVLGEALVAWQVLGALVLIGGAWLTTRPA
jgi:drug/metabolite transporter (DMT)-like permease